MRVLNIQPLGESKALLQVLASAAAGGFPSPAADFYEPPISLDELLNIRAPHVWIVEVEGHSMNGAGIFHGSRLVVDRALTASSGQIVLAYVDNQPVVKRLIKREGAWMLVSENPEYEPIVADDFSQIEIFGVVAWSLTPHAQP